MAEAGESLGRHDLEAKIVKHCWEDDEFRKKFIADPAGTFVKYLDVPAANLPKIVVHEEEAGSWHIVLPAKPSMHWSFLTKISKKIAGGTTPTITLVSAVSSLILTPTQAISEDKGGW